MPVGPPPGPPGFPGGGVPPPFGSPAPPPHDQTQVRLSQSDRRWLVPTLLIVLVAVSLGVAGLLLGGSGAGDLFDGTADGEEEQPETPAESLTISEATAFDPPPGDGSEHDDEVGLVFDGLSDEVWDTEWYHTATLGSLKPGVGFYVTLAEEAEISEIAIESSSEGWNAEIYVADRASDDIDGWGEPAGTVQGASSGVTPIQFDEPVSGRVVLVWFTFLSPQPDDPRFRVDVSEVDVRGR
jgi:hypothetical protein